MAKVKRDAKGRIIKLIPTPELLYQYWQEYRAWCEANPLTRNDWRGAGPVEVFLHTPRPHTLAGFEGYLSERDIIASINDYLSNIDNAYTDFIDVVRQIRAESKAHVLDGALAGVFKENLAGRYLGIPQVVEQKISHELNEAADVKKLNAGELKQLENLIDKQYNSEDNGTDELDYSL